MPSIYGFCGKTKVPWHPETRQCLVQTGLLLLDPEKKLNKHKRKKLLKQYKFDGMKALCEMAYANITPEEIFRSQMNAGYDPTYMEPVRRGGRTNMQIMDEMAPFQPYAMQVDLTKDMVSKIDLRPGSINEVEMRLAQGNDKVQAAAAALQKALEKRMMQDAMDWFGNSLKPKDD